MRPRVLHFVDSPENVRWFQVLVKASGFDAVALGVATLQRAGGLQAAMREAGITTFALDADSRADYPRAAVALARRLRQGRYDVIHTHLFESTVVGLVAAKLAQSTAAVMTAHHCHETPMLSLIPRTVDELCVRSLADLVIAPSQHMRNVLVNTLKVKPDRVAVVEHGFDSAYFDPTRADGRAVRQELRIAEDRIVLLALSRAYRIKNLDSLLLAFVDVAKHHPLTHLVIMGGGDQRPLRALSSSLGIAERVRFSSDRSDVPEVLAACDLLVHPSIAESFGQVIVEAMLMQRPPVAADVGISPQVVEDGVTGFRMPKTTPEAIATTLHRALRDREHWRRMGDAARSRALRFRPHVMAEGYEEIYRRLLARRPSSQDDLRPQSPATFASE